MFKKTLLMVALTAMVAAPAMAQEKKVEISVTGGWSFADGVDTPNGIVAGNGILYNRVDPKDGFKWGIGGAALAGPNLEVGFLFSQLMTKLTLGGTSTLEIGDMNVNNYHGYVGYNFGHPDATARGYFIFGLGATQTSSVDYTRINGLPGTISSSSRFSTTWGLGVKIAPNRPVGARFGVQWTPTYVRSDASGYWCDPYWGCYLGGVAKYANQWDLNGGLSFRF